MGITAVRLWFKGNRKGRRKSRSCIRRPYCQLSVEQLEDRSLLSAFFSPTTVNDFYLPSGFSHFSRSNDGVPPGAKIIQVVGGTTYWTVVLGAPIEILGITNAHGSLIYEKDNFAMPSGPGLLAKDTMDVLSPSTTFTATTPAGSVVSQTDYGIEAQAASTWVSANLVSAVFSPNSDSSTPSLPFMPTSMTEVNGTLFIQGVENGAEELWASDGTANGTILLNSFVPTVMESMIDGGRNHAVVNGTFFFTSDDGVHGLQLWKSDGTPNGTVMVKDINPGGGNSYPSLMTNVNGALFFSAYDGVGNSLWKSDGTADGTVEIAQEPVIGAIAAVNGNALFTVDDASGWSLWKSDGTAAGTNQLALVNPYGNCVSFGLVSLNGSVYFTPDWNGGLSSQYYHMSLWKSDGTVAGTGMLSGLHSDAGFSYAYLGNDANSTLYFPVYSGSGGFFDNYATPPTDMYELWKSDGTAAGTGPIKAIGWAESLTDVNGNVFFSVDNGTLGSALWTSDGTANGTVDVKDFGSFGSQTGGSPIDLTNVNGTLYFTLASGAQGLQIWKSDGTQAGTVQVANLDLQSPWMNPWTQFANANGTLFFTGVDGQGNTELWKSDGTSAGTVLVKVFGDPGSASTGGSPGSSTNPTDWSPGSSSDPTNSLEVAAADFVQAAQLLNGGAPAAASSSTSTPSNGNTVVNFAVNANSIVAVTSNTGDQPNRTSGSLIVAASHHSSGFSAISTSLKADTSFELEDPVIVFRV